MFWLIVFLIFGVLAWKFGADKALDIMLFIPPAVAFIVVAFFFYFLVLPSQFWKGL